MSTSTWDLPRRVRELPSQVDSDLVQFFRLGHGGSRSPSFLIFQSSSIESGLRFFPSLEAGIPFAGPVKVGEEENRGDRGLSRSVIYAATCLTNCCNSRLNPSGCSNS